MDLLKKLEQTENLQKEFKALRISAAPAEKEGLGEYTWTLFGEIPWLVAAADISGGNRVVIACEARFALDEALKIVGQPGAAKKEMTIKGLQDPNGLSLGPAFPNARLILPPTLLISSIDSSHSRTTVYLLMMGLAVGLAIIGSVFFWRDVRRDLETAELRSLFVASVSHELKTPLAAIRMFAPKPCG